MTPAYIRPALTGHNRFITPLANDRRLQEAQFNSPQNQAVLRLKAIDEANRQKGQP